MPKKLFPLLIVVLLALGGMYYYKHYVAAPSIDLRALRLYTASGEPFDINSLRGKKVIVSMYASWCGNCHEELEAISKIKGSELGDVEVVCISDEPIEKVSGFAQHKGYPFTFLKMEQGFNEVGIYSIPVTYFLNTSLEVVEEKLGYIPWDDLSTVRHLKSLM